MTIFYPIKVPLLYFFGASENIPFLKSLKSTPIEKQTDVVLKPSKKMVLSSPLRENRALRVSRYYELFIDSSVGIPASAETILTYLKQNNKV